MSKATLDQAMRQAAEVSQNGRTWAQALHFCRLRAAIMQQMSWSFREWQQHLEAAKRSREIELIGRN